MVQARSLLDESPANSFPISVAVGRRAPAANVACAQAGIIESRLGKCRYTVAVDTWAPTPIEAQLVSAIPCFAWMATAARII